MYQSCIVHRVQGVHHMCDSGCTQLRKVYIVPLGCIRPHLGVPDIISQGCIGHHYVTGVYRTSLYHRGVPDTMSQGCTRHYVTEVYQTTQACITHYGTGLLSDIGVPDIVSNGVYVPHIVSHWVYVPCTVLHGVYVPHIVSH